MRSDYEFVKMPPPHDKSEWVKTVARIIWLPTKEVRDYQEESCWDEENQKAHTYIWEEGNFACQCNRHLFFGRAGGFKPDKSSCDGEDYLVNLYTSKNKLIYQEWDETTKKGLTRRR